MDTINIFLSVWKLFSVIQGLVCGGLVAAGILLSWMLRSNLHGETETEKEFAQQHKISYYQIAYIPRFILLPIYAENPAYL